MKILESVKTMKNKNILKENMNRFGTKNLSEQEAVGRSEPISVNIQPNTADWWKQKSGMVNPKDYEKLKIELTKALENDEVIITILPDRHRTYVEWSPSHLPTRVQNYSLQIPLNDLSKIIPQSTK